MESKITSPLLHSRDLLKQDCDEITDAPYREALGAIQYLANCYRPDIQFATNFLSRFSQHPTTKHWTAVKRLIKYIYKTRDYAVTYTKQPLELKTYSDANWANDELDRRSISGIIILLSGAPIVFESKKQTNTTLSTAESEYVAASEATREMAGVRNLLMELGFSNITSHLYIDN